ncbi:Protein phosphatase 2c [Operophtera brumata]|uniref:Protein phosphatase 2c n=1 Tax=Operophtera brumata TaxID=104452 RepID=A0A0L7KVW2_OPEBR|nr:Protein phosphatase 2c [Operophtera brumata]
MPASIGVNLRVTGHCSQGGRKYMEDLFSVAYQQTEDERDLEYAFFGIYDGHGGSEAAAFAKEHLMDSIVKQRQFWSDNDEDVLKAIRNGYMLTHLNMWKELEKWPKTVGGLPSTAGTTASVAFIRRGKIYIGHVGDSAIVLGYQKEDTEEWFAKPLTLDHKPESTAEIERIQKCGGKVISKSGVPRVVWNRPRAGHKGPIKKNTLMDEIPFLAVARSLGDLWSYNPRSDECLIFGTDGLWNMMSPEGAVSLVQATERHNEAALVGSNATQPRDWLNPSKSLVDHALERTTATKSTPSIPPVMSASPETEAKSPAVPQNGLTIMTRYTDPDRVPVPDAPIPTPLLVAPPVPETNEETEDSDTMTTYGNPAESYFMARLLTRTKVVNTLAAVLKDLVSESPEPRVTPQLRESLPATLVPEPTAAPVLRQASPPPAPAVVSAVSAAGDAPQPEEPNVPPDDGGIQINEVSSSSPTEVTPKSRGRRNRNDLRKDAPARPDRVLRSHHEPGPPRPQTRQATDRQTRGKPAAPPMDRVVILTRRTTPPVPTTLNETVKLERAPSLSVKLERAPAVSVKVDQAPAESVKVERAPSVKVERAPSVKVEQAADSRPRKSDVEEEKKGGRATRSQAGSTPLAQKITRSIGAYARELRGAAVAFPHGAFPILPEYSVPVGSKDDCVVYGRVSVVRPMVL